MAKQQELHASKRMRALKFAMHNKWTHSLRLQETDFGFSSSSKAACRLTLALNLLWHLRLH